MTGEFGKLAITLEQRKQGKWKQDQCLYMFLTTKGFHNLQTYGKVQIA